MIVEEPLFPRNQCPGSAVNSHYVQHGRSQKMANQNNPNQTPGQQNQQPGQKPGQQQGGGGKPGQQQDPNRQNPNQDR
jgi:hypothetical protein